MPLTGKEKSDRVHELPVVEAAWGRCGPGCEAGLLVWSCVCPHHRFRLARLKNCLNIQMVRRYQDKRGNWKVAGVPGLCNKDLNFEFKAGGRDLSRSSAYPVGLGLKAGDAVIYLIDVC